MTRPRKPYTVADGVSVSLIIESAHREELDRLAKYAGVSMSHIVRKILDKALAASPIEVIEGLGASK